MLMIYLTEYRPISFLLFITLSLAFIGCHHSSKKPIIRSFCYWKTELQMDNEEKFNFNDLKIKHLYLRFFDVDWNSFVNEPRPIATVNLNWPVLPPNLEITPCIFITNAVFLQSRSGQIDTLAIKIANRIGQVETRYDSHAIQQWANVKHANDSAIQMFLLKDNIHDLLIDCDWTPSTQKSYFHLLDRLKQILPTVKITTTLRLWQYNNPLKSGIPPVSRCLLMCYNLQSQKDYNVDNSISNTNQLGKYLKQDNYPIKCDVALPIFRWAVLFRGGKYKGILANLDFKYCQMDTVNYHYCGDNRFNIKRDELVNDQYLRVGDELRFEYVSPDQLDKMIELIKEKVPIRNDARISFFSWNKKYIDDYGTKKIKSFYDHFSD